MLILSLDTTTRAGSAALVRDGTVIREHTGDPLVTHGQRLPTDLMRLLDEAGVRLGDVDLFAVAAGPGSFTGLRVGIATIQGLAVAGGQRVVPLSVLDALARAAREAASADDVWLAPWMDAQRGEVFAAVYEADARTLVLEPTSATAEATLAAWEPLTRGRRVRFLGDGALRYRETIEARLGENAQIVNSVPALAGIIGRIATERADTAVLPHAVVPIYIRRPDAELARSRRTSS